jgi:hypothetical protein
MTQNAQANLNSWQAAQLAALLRATLQAIAEQLNQLVYRTLNRKAFHAMVMQRLLMHPSKF